MEKVGISYDKNNLIVMFNKPSTEFVKGYVYYLLEYLLDDGLEYEEVRFSDGVVWKKEELR